MFSHQTSHSNDSEWSTEGKKKEVDQSRGSAMEQRRNSLIHDTFCQRELLARLALAASSNAFIRAFSLHSHGLWARVKEGGRLVLG